MDVLDQAIRFPCEGAELYGILSLPFNVRSRGVVIVVGGPQYRIGSHRQFVLLSRRLAQEGTPVLRFDYRGMGDSEGEVRSFANVKDDIAAAIDHFFASVPALREVVIFGLCDAASAALFYASHDTRVTGLILANPWVRTDEGIAEVYLKHYYVRRLFDGEFWKKLMRGRIEFSSSAKSLVHLLSSSVLGRMKKIGEPTRTANMDFGYLLPLPDRMLHGLAQFSGNVLFLFSGNDLTAKEFLDLVKKSPKWRARMASPRIEQRNLPTANHTFSRQEWRSQIEDWTSEWIKSW